MQEKNPAPFAVAKWILGAGTTLLVGVIVLTNISDKRKPDLAGAPKTASARSEGKEASAPRVAEEVPPWEASRQKQESLPPGVVPASEIDPPPPDPNLPIPPPPVEPPNPTANRP